MVSATDLLLSQGHAYCPFGLVPEQRLYLGNWGIGGHVLFAEQEGSTVERKEDSLTPPRPSTPMHNLPHRRGILHFRTQSRRITTLRSTTHLPNHVSPTLRQHPPLSGTPPPTFPFLNPEVVPPRPSQEELSPAGKLFKLTWPTNPRNVLVVKKRRDEKVKQAAIEFAK